MPKANGSVPKMVGLNNGNAPAESQEINLVMLPMQSLSAEDTAYYDFWYPKMKDEKKRSVLLRAEGELLNQLEDNKSSPAVVLSDIPPEMHELVNTLARKCELKPTTNQEGSQKLRFERTQLSRYPSVRLELIAEHYDEDSHDESEDSEAASQFEPDIAIDGSPVAADFAVKPQKNARPQEIARPQEPPKDDVSNLRVRAKSGLKEAMVDGRMQSYVEKRSSQKKATPCSGPNMMVNAIIRPSSIAEAQNVRECLGDAEYLKELIVRAIRSTPGIQAVKTGPIEAVKAELGVAVTRNRGRMTAIEDEIVMLSNGALSRKDDGNGLVDRQIAAEEQLSMLKMKDLDLDSKEHPHRKDFISTVFDSAYRDATTRLNLEAKRARFVVTIMSVDGVRKISRIEPDTDLYCTCMVSERADTRRQTNAVKVGLEHEFNSEFSLRMAKDEALELALYAQSGGGRENRILGSGSLEASKFFEDERNSSRKFTVKLKGCPKDISASLIVQIVSMRATDMEREEAAVRIQAMHRKRQAKAKVEEMRAPAIQRKQPPQTRSERDEPRNQEQEQAAVVIQKNLRSREARARVANMRMEKQEELLRDIALMASPADRQNKREFGGAQGWNRSGLQREETMGTLRDRSESFFESPYGTGIEWQQTGYRLPTASPSTLKRFLQEEEQEVNVRISKDRSALGKFKEDLRRREQSLAAAWRSCLDPDWQGKLAIHEFCEACRNIGYRGNVKDVWRAMDVDGNGLISLAELDWEEARDLGEFHRKLVADYGSAAEAAKNWGMQGPRRFRIDDFFEIVLTAGYAQTATEADHLFRMMCDVPVQGECCGHLGVLTDEATAVTYREMLWLDSLGPELPHVTKDRVQPGDLGHLEGGKQNSEAKKNMKIKIKHDMDSFFDHMYKDAVEHHRRKKEISEPPKPVEKTLSDPSLFQRLHNDHAQLMEKRKQLAEEEDSKMNEQANWRTGQRDPRAKDRVLAPRKKFAEFNFDCTAKREHLWHLLTIDQLMYECNKLVEEVLKVDDPGFEFSSFGKSRNELVEFLWKNTPEKPRLGVGSADLPPPAPAIQALHDDHEERKERIGKLQQDAIVREDQAFKSTLICPMHGAGLTSDKCGTCRRYKAMKGELAAALEDPDKQWNHAKTVVAQKIEYRERNFKALIEEGYRKGLVANRTNLSCRIALEDAFSKDDKRWQLCVGRDRDRLIAEGVKYYTAKFKADEARKKATEDKHMEKNATTFYRLHISGISQKVKSEDDFRRKQDAEMAALDVQSVHRNVPPHGSIFEILYENEDRIPDDPRFHMWKESQRRAELRAHRKKRYYDRTQKALDTIRATSSSPARKPLLLDELEPPTKAFEKVAAFYYPTCTWRPVSKFEIELRVRLEELGAVNVTPSEMPCRFRRLADDKAGMVLELRGITEHVQKVVHVAKSIEVVTCSHKLKKVWAMDYTDDACGEFLDHLLYHNDSLEDAWRKHFAQSGAGGMQSPGITYDKLTMKARQMNFTGDLKKVWHALKEFTAQGERITYDNFIKLQKALRPARLPKDATDPPSKQLITFAEAIHKIFASCEQAFKAIDTDNDGNINSTEFVAAVKKMHWAGHAAKLFSELDVADSGVVTLEEFSRLALPEVRMSKLNTKLAKIKDAVKGGGSSFSVPAADPMRRKTQSQHPAPARSAPQQPPRGGSLRRSLKESAAALISQQELDESRENKVEDATPAKGAAKAASQSARTPSKKKTTVQSPRTSPRGRFEGTEPESEPRARTPDSKNGSGKIRPASAPGRPRSAR